jgi:hypothetical protein
MQDCMDLGPAPTCETCAQVGRPDYAMRARRECLAYVKQLRRLFGEEPEGARLAIKANPHDFGTYFSVVCYFEDKLPSAMDYAFRLEKESPENWDGEARKELELPAEGS